LTIAAAEVILGLLPRRYSLVEEVEPADRRRDDEHRALADAAGGRVVLDQLGDLVPFDDRAGGQGQVAADLQGLRVGHRGQAAVVPQIADPVAQPAD
jgi:hypothetical protein